MQKERVSINKTKPNLRVAASLKSKADLLVW